MRKYKIILISIILSGISLLGLVPLQAKAKDLDSKVIAPLHLDILTLNTRAKNIYKTNPDSAQYYAKKALDQSKSLDFEIGIILSLNRIGQAYSKKKEYDSAEYAFEEALQFPPTKENATYLASVRNNAGLLYKNRDKYPEAIQQYLNGLQVLDGLPPTIELGAIYNNLAVVYMRLEAEGYPEAKNYLKKAISTRKILEDHNGLASSYTNQGNLAARQEQWEEAIVNYRKAFFYYNSVNNQKGIQRVQRNLVFVYQDMGEAQNSSSVFDPLEDRTLDAESIALILNSKGAFEYNQNNPALALPYFQKAINVIDADSINALSIRKHLYTNLSKSYQATGNYKKAYQALQEYIPVTDSLDSKAKLQEIAKYEKAFELEQKKTQLALQEKTITEQNNQLLQMGLLLIGLLFSIAIIIAFYYLRLQTRKREHQEKMDQMVERQQEKMLGAMLKGQEKAQGKLAKELHDNIGMLLSTVNLHFSRFEEKLDAQNEALTAAKSTLQKAVKEVRSISHQMHSGTEQHLGLVEALQALAVDIESSGELQVSIQAHGMEASHLPNSVTHSLYRIIQELFSNVIRHAKANKIEIELTNRKADLNLIFRDNGQGFNTEENTKQEGIGLKSIRSRVAHLNGKVHFDSTLKKGTTAIITIPRTQSELTWMEI